VNSFNRAWIRRQSFRRRGQGRSAGARHLDLELAPISFSTPFGQFDAAAKAVLLAQDISILNWHQSASALRSAN
jgi:hypothetical protein